MKHYFFVLSLVVTSFVSITAAEAKSDHSEELKKLEAVAEASLYFCYMKTKVEYLNYQNGKSNIGKVTRTVSTCAEERTNALEEYLEKVKSSLKDNTSAISLLKEWYSSWLAMIRNISYEKNSPDTTSLEEKMNRVVVESTW